MLSATLRAAVSRVGATASLPEKIEAVIEDQAAEDLNAALVALIRDLPTSAVEILEEPPPPSPRSGGLALRLKRTPNPDGSPKKMLFI